MKYYGERTNKLYNTEKECMEAEFKAKEKENLEKIEKERALAVAKEKKEKEVAERKALAAEVDAARKAFTEAQKNYHDKLQPMRLPCPWDSPGKNTGVGRFA